jgi:uncharacterized protein (DUF983 family)
MTHQKRLKMITWVLSLMAFAICAALGLRCHMNGGVDGPLYLVIAFVSFIGIWLIYGVLLYNTPHY